MLIMLKENIEWICIILEGIILLYLYYNYRKNRNSDGNKIVITKRNGYIIIAVLIIVNIILVISKIIGMFKN